MMRDRRYSDRELTSRLLQLARPYWLHVIGLCAVSFLASPIALLAPFPLKIAVDSGIGSRPLPAVLHAVVPNEMAQSQPGALVIAAILVLAVAILSQIQDLASSLLRTYTGEKLVLAFRAQLFRRVQRLPLAYHDTRGTADSIYRMQNDAVAIQNIAIDGVIPFLTASVTFAVMLTVMLSLDWQLALVALGVSPVHYLTARLYRMRLRGRAREVKRLDSLALALLQETLGAIRVVKAFGQEDQHEQRFVQRSEQSVFAKLRLAYTEGRLGLLTRSTTAAGTAGTLLIGAWHVRSGTLTLGELLLLMGYLAQFYGPVTTIGKKVATIQSHLASAERALSLLDEPSDVPEKPTARALKRAAGEVSFEHISFAYEERLVLHDISFAVAPGSRVGIMGATGAGKTTLVNLLTRFYDPTAGRILLDGIDLRDYRLADLRNQFAIVLQEPVLFSVSIAENIAYARPGAAHDEIVTAAKAANAHEFIVDLPNGYETLVGERGMRLSGGERQRISLARAFLKDASILVLDEPTSSVDSRTEATIIEAMERLAQGRTTFMITHRVATLTNCDVMLQLARGRLIERSAAPPFAGAAALVGRGQAIR